MGQDRGAGRRKKKPSQADELAALVATLRGRLRPRRDLEVRIWGEAPGDGLAAA